MVEQQRASDDIHERGGTGKTLKRRGILAAAGAVVAGIVARQTSEHVAAAASMQFANTTTEVMNIAQGQTDLQATLTFTTNTIVLNVDASPSAATFDAVGVVGRGSGLGPGVMGLMDGVT